MDSSRYLCIYLGVPFFNVIKHSEINAIIDISEQSLGQFKDNNSHFFHDNFIDIYNIAISKYSNKIMKYYIYNNSFFNGINDISFFENKYPNLRLLSVNELETISLEDFLDSNYYSLKKKLKLKIFINTSFSHEFIDFQGKWISNLESIYFNKLIVDDFNNISTYLNRFDFDFIKKDDNYYKFSSNRISIYDRLIKKFSDKQSIYRNLLIKLIDENKILRLSTNSGTKDETTMNLIHTNDNFTANKSDELSLARCDAAFSIYSTSTSSKVFDCFLFSNEFHLLDLRLEYYADIVDVFILVESDVSFRGDPKQSNFTSNHSKYKKYIDSGKLVFSSFHTDTKFTKSSCYDIENQQRNYIYNILNGLASYGDKIFLSDIDEFWNKELINQCNTIPRVFSMNLFYYYFNLMDPTQKWMGTTYSPWNLFDTAQCMRSFYKTNIWSKYSHYENDIYLSNGGWHFSYIGGFSNVLIKLATLSDTHDIVDQLGNIDVIEKRYRSYTSLWDSNKQYNLVDLNDLCNIDMTNLISSYPEYFLQNNERQN